MPNVLDRENRLSILIKCRCAAMLGAYHNWRTGLDADDHYAFALARQSGVELTGRTTDRLNAPHVRVLEERFLLRSAWLKRTALAEFSYTKSLQMLLTFCLTTTTTDGIVIFGVIGEEAYHG
jgi:hypothetical protein